MKYFASLFIIVVLVKESLNQDTTTTADTTADTTAGGRVGLQDCEFVDLTAAAKLCGRFEKIKVYKVKVRSDRNISNVWSYDSAGDR